MPELPELQAHAERLTEEFGGTTIDRRLRPTHQGIRAIGR